MKQKNKSSTFLSGYCTPQEGYVSRLSPRSSLRSRSYFGGVGQAAGHSRKALDKIALGLFASLILALPIFTARAEEKCDSNNSNICLSVDSSISGSLPANQNVRLTFGILNKTGGTICPAGKNLYSFVVHFKAGSFSQEEYLYAAAGPQTRADFNSGPNGQSNIYETVFYCNTATITPSVGLGGISAQIGRLRNTNLAWTTPSFNMVTGAPASRPATTPPGPPAAPGPAPAPPPGAAAPGKFVDCEKNPNEQDCLYNPLPTDALTDVFLLIVKGFLGIVAIWGVMFIIVGGFRMVMAAGNEEAYTQAKKTITWAILGVVVALLSFSIMAIVQNLLHANIK